MHESLGDALRSSCYLKGGAIMWAGAVNDRYRSRDTRVASSLRLRWLAVLQLFK